MIENTNRHGEKSQICRYSGFFYSPLIKWCHSVATNAHDSQVRGLSLLINKIGWPYKKEFDKILLTHTIF